MDKETLEAIAQAASTADFVLIGAGNGMDMAESLDIFRPSRHFVDAYGDLAQRYGVMSVLQGVCGLPAGSEAQWEFAKRFARVEWLGYEPSDAMTALRQIVGDREHFILTYNFNGRFARSGFDEGRIFEVEGTVRHLICTRRCTNELYDSEEYLLQDLPHAPSCPNCGAPLELSVREDRLVAPDMKGASQLGAFEEFCQRMQGSRILILELGIGPHNRSVKGPLARIAARELGCTYVTFNYDAPRLPEGLQGEGHCVSGDLGSALIDIARSMRE